MADWASSYRPEKHYMRGPGPKWREKHLRMPMPPIEDDAKDYQTPMSIWSAH